jgi:hypothetical protein
MAPIPFQLRTLMNLWVCDAIREGEFRGRFSSRLTWPFVVTPCTHRSQLSVHMELKHRWHISQVIFLLDFTSHIVVYSCVGVYVYTRPIHQPPLSSSANTPFCRNVFTCVFTFSSLRKRTSPGIDNVAEFRPLRVESSNPARRHMRCERNRPTVITEGTRPNRPSC